MKRRYQGRDLSKEEYVDLQRQNIINAAVNKAKTRTIGAAPTIERDGYTGASCLYTVTDNFGNKYRIGGTQTLMANPEKFGFAVSGPIEQSKLGDVYMFIDENGKPFHSSIITDYKDGVPLVSYSEGNAQREIDAGHPIFTNSENGVSSDYIVNNPIWNSPYYETLRFIGTPKDNERWNNEYMNLPESIEPLPIVKSIKAKAMDKGGQIDEKYADTKKAVLDSAKRRNAGPITTAYMNVKDSTAKFIKNLNSKPRVRAIGYFTAFNPYEHVKMIENGGSTL